VRVGNLERIIVEDQRALVACTTRGYIPAAEQPTRPRRKILLNFFASRPHGGDGGLAIGAGSGKFTPPIHDL
jgi:hypothetical protein